MALLSIIIPTFNEAPRIAALIRALRALPGPAREIIVSDGGSSDETARFAHKSGAIVVETARGRGAQLNAGAQIASGEILWFVHADARLHQRSLDYLQRCARDARIYGGNFRLRFKADNWASHLFARIARQQRRLGLYYGDSGIWVQREVFAALKGYRHLPLFEDYDFARRLENYAHLRDAQTALAPLPITVSSRRFREKPLRILGQWLWLQTLFCCGVPPEHLAQSYHPKE